MSLALLLVGCAADDPPRSAPQAAQGPTARQPRATVGGSGDFGNSMQPALAGSAAPTPPEARASCRGGRYAGKYSCALEVFGIPAALDGEVSFLLEIGQTAAPSGCQEFCPDLVIAKGSGTLFGLAGDTGWGFEAELQGGLDCRTGEFRATAPKGIYGLAGSNDANDPNALSTVLDPPLGDFNGMFSGMHVGGTPERITGDWDLVDAAELARCSGPFMVQLQQ
ncbi:MAG TPA: hypothetical protein VJV78_00295 [Polyangiales bacterium]|nr:hypothetical protein [Polyangiales bacterium]